MSGTRSELLELLLLINGGSIESTSELDRLAEMLDDAGIPYKKSIRQICYYGHRDQPAQKEGVWQGMAYGAVLSVIVDGYDGKQGFLEAMGLRWNAEGHLKADEIFEAIKTHWENEPVSK